jgi:hypothetical protein
MPTPQGTQRRGREQQPQPSAARTFRPVSAALAAIACCAVLPAPTGAAAGLGLGELLGGVGGAALASVLILVWVRQRQGSSHAAPND